jgi:G3E family GTPase
MLLRSRRPDEGFQVRSLTLAVSLSGHFRDLLAQRAKFDYIIVETSGLADPAPSTIAPAAARYWAHASAVIQTFFVDQAISGCLKLDAIATVHMRALRSSSG